MVQQMFVLQKKYFKMKHFARELPIKQILLPPFIQSCSAPYSELEYMENKGQKRA